MPTLHYHLGNQPCALSKEKLVVFVQTCLLTEIVVYVGHSEFKTVGEFYCISCEL